MRWPIACFLLLIAGCPPPTPPPVTVVARAPDHSPVVGGIVGWVCKPAGANGADVTDKTGTAHIVVFDREATDCIVTVAKIGYQTVQLTGQPIEPLDVTLEVSP